MDLDIRYVAGLFDGEGWITVSVKQMNARGYVNYQLFVGIGMVHKPIIDALKHQFGGNIFIKRPSPGQSARTRTSSVWRLSSGPAAGFLGQILPYLVVKREEAEIAIEFQQHIRRHTNDFKYRPHMRDELYAYRNDVVSQLRALKRREYFSPVDGDPMLAA